MTAACFTPTQCPGHGLTSATADEDGDGGGGGSSSSGGDPSTGSTGTNTGESSSGSGSSSSGGGSMCPSLDENSSSSGAPGPDECGNGIIDGFEQCEPRDLGGFSCDSLGLGTGLLCCDPVRCRFDTSNCVPPP